MVKIILDLNKNVEENAEVYFNKAKKIKKKLEGAKEALERSLKEYEKLKKLKIKEEISLPTPTAHPVKKEWYEKFHWFSSSEGYLVLGGRDAVTNEILLKKYTDSNDVILHTDIPGSPFGVIKTKGSQPSENVIKEAAQMVASYSKAWRMGVSTIDVYWIKPEQVSKTPPSGEYLPRGSFMIHGSRNYLKNVPLKLAVGIKETPHGYEVIGGPPSAITAQTKIFVEIAPGRVKASKLIKNLITKLIEKASNEQKSNIQKIQLEDIQAFIPGGGGEIT